MVQTFPCPFLSAHCHVHLVGVSVFAVRHGATGDAVLEVTLLNNEAGFKFDEYGKSITVRRTIKQPTGGGFALLSEDMAVSDVTPNELVRQFSPVRSLPIL